MGHCREIAEPAFPDDDGSVAEEFAQALAGYRADRRGGYLPALEVLQSVRLLVPVVAVLGEVETDENGLPREKNSEMATVLLTRPDGRRGLLAFSGTDPMAAWDPQARPVPVTAVQAAQAALSDGADALVVDVAGPVTLAVEGTALQSLAEGLRLRRLPDGWGWTRELPAR